MLKGTGAPPIGPILQFGTSRFLLAHADLFVSQALARGAALGSITIVQTTASAESAARVAALAGGAGYPVRVRGLRQGTLIDETLHGTAVRGALHADAHWAALRDAVAGPVRVILSNTGDRGYLLDPSDGVALIDVGAPVPRSFPAKLLVLLHGRWRQQPAAGPSIFPCELTARNGDTLRGLVAGLAVQWSLPQAFIGYLHGPCRWANSLVDRIVSEPLPPAGAVAEPYALWAIERQPGLELPCTHEAIVLTDDLQRYERLKLYLLNLGHSYLAERWLRGEGPADQTVRAAMGDAASRAALEAVWAEEVLPVFDALGLGRDAVAYLVELRERLLNPFLAHRLAEIAQNHAQKLQRRFVPVIELAGTLRLSLPQSRLRAALQAPPAQR